MAINYIGPPLIRYSILASVLVLLPKTSLACSLTTCRPNTQHCFNGHFGADCSGYVGCFKKCPPGSSHGGQPLVPAQCNGTRTPSPYDSCNTCHCKDGLIELVCTKAGCPTKNKKEGEYCVDKKNNCEEGLYCIWDKQPNGVGKCSSRPGSQAKLMISGSDGYNYPNISITFSDGTKSNVIVTGPSDMFQPEEGRVCIFDGVVADQPGSKVKLIGCIQQKERHASDQMTIMLAAFLDSGWYTAYYASEFDDFVTVKKTRKRPNIKGSLKPRIKQMNCVKHRPECCDDMRGPCAHHGCVLPICKDEGKCPGACLHVHRPVCGSDGKTYSNFCYLEMAKCQHDPSLTLEHPGECKKVSPNLTQTIPEPKRCPGSGVLCPPPKYCCYGGCLRPGDICKGRPFVVEGSARTVISKTCDDSDADYAKSWHTGLTPSSLENGTINHEVGRRWVEHAEGEHASVASFARNTLQLLTLGSPSELLVASQQAAIDEINHAKISYDIASTITGLKLAPGPLDVQESMKKVDLMSVTRSIIHEGCVGETLAAVEARVRGHATEEQYIKKSLLQIAEEETNHAQLAWDTIEWIAGRNPDLLSFAENILQDELERQMRKKQAFSAQLGELACENPYEDGSLQKYGFLTRENAEKVTEAGIRDIILPAHKSGFVDVGLISKNMKNLDLSQF